MNARATVPVFEWDAPPGDWEDADCIDGELATALLCEAPALAIRNGFLRRSWVLTFSNLDDTEGCYRLHLWDGCEKFYLEVKRIPQQDAERGLFAVQSNSGKANPPPLEKGASPVEELELLLPTLREIV